MFCQNCGKKIKEGSKFCAGCGSQVNANIHAEANAQEAMSYQADIIEDNVAEKRHKKKRKLRILPWIVIIVLLCLAGTGIYLFLNSDYYNIQKNLKLAEKRLEEGNEREALNRYRAVYTLDKEHVEAYVKSAEIYLEMGEYEDAYEVLNEGLEATGAETFAEKIAYVKENLVPVKQTIYEDGNMTGWVEFEYDESINLRKGKVHNDVEDSSFSQWEAKFGVVDNGTKGVMCDATGNVVGGFEKEYDEAGNQTKWIVHAEDGSIIARCEREYDEVGNETKYIEYDENDSITEWHEREYDEAGNEIKFVAHDEDGSISEWYEFEYDEAGNEIKRVYYRAGGGTVIEEWYESEFDVYGNKICYSFYDEDTSGRYEYEYSFIGKAWN